MGQRKTPIMGWASWNCFRTNISEGIIKKQAEALVSTGLAKHGYNYVNIDDGFFGGRDASGMVRAHKGRFPNGMKALADFIHSLGFHAGIYAEAGDNTCGYYADNEGANGKGVGLYGHEGQDLQMYLVDWGYDFIKVDWCGGLRLGLDEKEQYTKIGSIIEAIRQKYNKDIVYNICRWQFPGGWAAETADSWRTGADITPCFSSVMHQIDMIKPLRIYCGPGHVNDLDMLQVGNGMSLAEDQTHFAMWCMMSTPLMIGCDLTKISGDRIGLLANDELIAVNQDAACLQAFVAKDHYENGILQWEIWVKDLGQEHAAQKAVAFLNRSSQAAQISAELAELGLSTDDAAAVKIRDVIKHCDLGYTGAFSFEVAPHGCIVLRITAPYAAPLTDRVKPAEDIPIHRVSFGQAMQMLQEGATFIDVRSREESGRSPIEGSVNIPYTDIHAEAAAQFPDKHAKLITYCKTGKRSFQAAKSLSYLGFTDLYMVKI